MDVLRQQYEELLRTYKIQRNEIRLLNEEIRELTRRVLKSNVTVRQLRTEIDTLRPLEKTVDELRQENTDLQNRLNRIPVFLKVESTDYYENLNRSGRRAMKRRLDRHFARCLKKVDNWASATIRINFDDNSMDYFWERTFINLYQPLDGPSKPHKQRSRWEDLHVMQIVHTTDKFMISNEAYHELRMVSERGLPSMYKFRQIKNWMSTQVDIEESNNDEVDAATRKIRDVLHAAQVGPPAGDKFFLKFAMDGAVVGQHRFGVAGCVKLFQCSKSGKPLEFIDQPNLLDEHPVIYFFGQEDYDTIKLEAARTFAELLEIERDGIEATDGNYYETELILTCDWKCFATLLGLSGPTSHCFCLFCCIRKEEKAQFTERDLGRWIISRSNEERLQYLGSEKNKGYKKSPLLEIPFEQCPPDFLHLCKQLIGKQLNQVVHWVIDQGNEHRLEAEMKRLNVHFKFYVVKSDEYSAAVRKWTSPSVADLRTIYEHMELSNVLDDKIDKSKKTLRQFDVKSLRYYCKKYNLNDTGKKDILMLRLIEKLGEFVKLNDVKAVGNEMQEVTGESTGEILPLNIAALQNLWKNGHELLNKVRDGVPDTDALAQELLNWGVQFKDVTFAEDVTPYVHVFTFHVAEFVKKYGGLGAFAMQEVERLNKVFKECFFRKTHQQKQPMRTAYQMMRYWNRILMARTHQYARESQRRRYFYTKTTTSIARTQLLQQFELDMDQTDQETMAAEADEDEETHSDLLDLDDND